MCKTLLCNPIYTVMGSDNKLRESLLMRGSLPREVSRAARRHRTCREFRALGERE
jgi:hypothetical protein